MDDSFTKASRIIIHITDENIKLRNALGKLLNVCLNHKMQTESELWMQQIGIAQHIFNETDPNKLK